jgi:hypothetical protein
VSLTRERPRPRFHLLAVPGPGCRPRNDATQTGIRDMHHLGVHADEATNNTRHHGDQCQGPQHGIGRSTRLDAAMASTVFVADLYHGMQSALGWHPAPSACLSVSDAPPPRRELAAPRGTTQPARDTNPGALQ